MRAIDTNVVVRFLTRDDERQFRQARAAIEGGGIFVSATVLLESEWVLRSAYGYRATRIAGSLRELAGLPGISIENPALLIQALDAMDKGMDFADALHLVAAKDCDVFLSFDRKLTKAAKKLGGVRVDTP